MKYHTHAHTRAPTSGHQEDFVNATQKGTRNAHTESLDETGHATQHRTETGMHTVSVDTLAGAGGD